MTRAHQLADLGEATNSRSRIRYSCAVKGEDRVRQIERIAAELFFTNGYHATTQREIAKAVGIRPASLYHHFESKQDLLFSVIQHTLDDLLAGAQAALASHSDPPSQIQALVRDFILLISERQHEGAVGDIELRSLEPENRQTLIAKRDKYQGTFEQIIDAGVEQGLFKVVDAKLTAYAILGMCNHVSIWYRPGGPRTIEEIAKIYADDALRLLGHG
jgi:AcrR family transcriptional regulator